ncbi:neuronal acetylcholine receptor subunit beta-3-like [Physella acuta]|uniref:neuronal acetylcholine receptor subunit beta-3-like n=1 Tax=Physella acuta TaxID=109671 RepID=UPI0027DD6B74|nr:neuronal acetylcholine receptor subunit beta-3-like [Physella acuta]
MASDLLKFLLALGLMHQVHGETHQHVLTLIKDKLSRDVYNPRVRPVKNSSDTTIVTVDIVLDSIFKVHVKSDMLYFNESICFVWTDEFLTWNPEDYGGIQSINPSPMMLWLPVAYSMHKPEKKHPLDNFKGLVTVYHNGLVVWNPETLPLDTRCVKGLFDHLECQVQLSSKIHPASELVFVMKRDLLETHRDTTDVGWRVLHTNTTIINKTMPPSKLTFSTIQFDFTIKPLFSHIDVMVICSMAMFSFLCVLINGLIPDKKTKFSMVSLLVIGHGYFVCYSIHGIIDVARLLNFPLTLFIISVMMEYLVEILERDQEEKDRLKDVNTKATSRNPVASKKNSSNTAEENGWDFELTAKDANAHGKINKLKRYKKMAENFNWVSSFFFCASWLCAVAFIGYELMF